MPDNSAKRWHALWEILAYTVIMLGGMGAGALAALGLWERSGQVIVIAVMVWGGCQLMLWRHAVVARETARHYELVRLLTALVKRLPPRE